MKNQFFLLLALWLVSVIEQGYSQTFSNVYDHFGREMGDAASNIEITPNGYAIFSSGWSANNEGRLGLRFIDNFGNTIEEYEYGNSGTFLIDGNANGALALENQIYCTAATVEFLVDSILHRNALVMSFNDDGGLHNSFEFLDSTLTVGEGVFQSSDGSLNLVGWRQTVQGEPISGFLMKIDSNFELSWMKSFSGLSNNLDVLLVGGIEAHDGGFLLNGRRKDPDSFDVCESLAFDIDPLVVKTDNEGNEEWRLNLGTCRGEPNAHVTKTSDGNYIAVSGIKYEENSVQGIQLLLPYVVKFDSAGQVLWQNTYGEPNYNCALTKTSELSDGNLINCGFRYDGGINTAHYWGLLIKIAQNGDSLWYRKYKFTDDASCTFEDVIETPGGGFIACGRAWPSDENPSYDTWVVKTDEYGCIIPGCHIGVEEFTEKYGRFKVGPNPVSQSENLVVFLPDVKDLSGLSFQLRSLSGQLVKSFVPDEGGTSYLLRMNDFAKGMYVLSLLKDGVQVQSEKVVVN